MYDDSHRRPDGGPRFDVGWVVDTHTAIDRLDMTAPMLVRSQPARSDVLKRLRNISWLTVSKAADMSSKTRITPYRRSSPR